MNFDFFDIRESLRNPLFYYVAVPVLAAIWVGYTAVYALPRAEGKWAERVETYNASQEKMREILELDPERLQQAKAQQEGVNFDFANAIDEIARLTRIRQSSYNLTTGAKIKRRAEQTQDAKVSINPVNVESFSKFLSIMLIKWPNLTCQQLRITKVKGMDDAWKVDLDFRYFY